MIDMATYLLLMMTAIVDGPFDTRIPWNLDNQTPVEFVGTDLLVDGNGRNGPITIKLIDIPIPVETNDRFMLLTRIRNENVEGPASFRLDCYGVEGGGKVEASKDPQWTITGSGEIREVWFPFTQNNGNKTSRVTLSFFLPGKGKVWIEPIRLRSVPFVVESSNPSMRVARSSILFAVTYGFLLVMLGVFPITRPWLILFLWSGLVIGSLLVLVSLGATFNVLPPPFRVTLWAGCLLALGCGIALPILNRRRLKDEMRRMQALDMVSG